MSAGSEAQIIASDAIIWSCSICFENYTNDETYPYILSCAHDACFTCIYKVEKCPHCRKDIKDPIPNTPLAQLIKPEAKIKSFERITEIKWKNYWLAVKEINSHTDENILKTCMIRGSNKINSIISSDESTFTPGIICVRTKRFDLFKKLINEHGYEFDNEIDSVKLLKEIIKSNDIDQIDYFVRVGECKNNPKLKFAYDKIPQIIGDGLDNNVIDLCINLGLDIKITFKKILLSAPNFYTDTFADHFVSRSKKHEFAYENIKRGDKLHTMGILINHCVLYPAHSAAILKLLKLFVLNPDLAFNKDLPEIVQAIELDLCDVVKLLVESFPVILYPTDPKIHPLYVAYTHKKYDIYSYLRSLYIKSDLIHLLIYEQFSFWEMIEAFDKEISQKKLF
jgi:hypothetical protein